MRGQIIFMKFSLTPEEIQHYSQENPELTKQKTPKIEINIQPTTNTNPQTFTEWIQTQTVIRLGSGKKYKIFGIINDPENFFHPNQKNLLIPIYEQTQRFFKKD